ncbi:MAG: zinc ribbon domain-containing protein [Pseudomonadota bacterium]
MPIYEYQCGDCGHQFEIMQKMSDDRLSTCPECAAESLQKLISKVGFQLKGTGWYETDFKNNGKKPADGKSDDGGSKKEDGAKDNKKADTGKPDSAKKETKSSASASPSE